jgi:hypothetical protein
MKISVLPSVHRVHGRARTFLILGRHHSLANFLADAQVPCLYFGDKQNASHRLEAFGGGSWNHGL